MAGRQLGHDDVHVGVGAVPGDQVLEPIRPRRSQREQATA
jgi:hypothetical protein